MVCSQHFFRFFEAYVKRSRLLCFVLLGGSAAFAQDAQQQPAQQPPAQQRPAQQQPAQQQPAEQQPPPQQQPASQNPPQEQPDTRTGNTRMPPPPPKVVDVRMPGEAGWYIGFTGWLPVGKPT